MVRSSWVPIPPGCDFTLANIPFGIASSEARGFTHHVVVAIGEHVLDLAAFKYHGGFDKLAFPEHLLEFFDREHLNDFAWLGQEVHEQIRDYLQDVLSSDTQHPEVLREDADMRGLALLPMREVAMEMPMHIGDYTDFYVGLNHAFNCGSLFRGPDNALQPNYYHMPIGYHGRASSVVLSGTPIRRPCGQVLDPATKKPIFRPCQRLDFELELGAFVCTGNSIGDSINVDRAERHIFGYVLMNDWSARDIQAWEYVPLGPFTAKNFGTSISPWVVLATALEPFKCPGLPNPEEPQAYLKQTNKDTVHDIKLQVDLAADDGEARTITKTSAKNLLFSFPQMIAHHTITGCPMTAGDLLGSGTISGTEPGSLGSLLEQSKGGREQISIGTQTRTFLEDGDTVTFRGWCQRDGASDDTRVGFGLCTGKILPAKPPARN